MKVPNKRTKKAIRQAEAIVEPKFKNIDQLFDSLGHVRKPEYALDELLKDFDPEKHVIPEIDWGSPRGNEIF